MTPWYAALTPEQRALIPYDSLDLDTQSSLPAPSLTWETAKPGMRVKINRKVESYSEGWKNSWVGEMTLALGSGRIFTIQDVSYPVGIFLDEIGYRWPPTAFTEVRE